MVNNSSTRYYQKTKKATQNKSLQKISSFSEEEREKKWYGRERYKNLPEHEKQSFVEYRKNYYKMWKLFTLTFRRT